MKHIFTYFFLICTLTQFSAQGTDSLLMQRLNKIESDSTKYIKLQDKLNSTVEKLEGIESLNEKTLDGISKQLDAATYNLSLFGILFGIVAICIGIYVTYVERKIVRIGEENRELLQKNEKIKVEVEELNRLIQNDIYGLHLKIKREETIHILDRLNKVPKDITNVCSILLSRELLADDFSKLRSAYIKVKELGLNYDGDDNDYIDYTEQYKIVLFQHFLNQVMKDDELRKDINEFIFHGIQSAFENDIIKSTYDFTSAIIDLGMYKFSSEITNYFNGLSASSHKNYSEVYQVFFDNLHTRKNRFDFFGLIESNDFTRKAKIRYGQLLIDLYKMDKPSVTEQLIFTELSQLIVTEEKAEEERRIQIEKTKKDAAERKAKRDAINKKKEDDKKEKK